MGIDGNSAVRLIRKKSATLKEFFEAEIDVASSEIMIGADSVLVAETSASNSKTEDNASDDASVDKLPF